MTTDSTQEPAAPYPGFPGQTLIYYDGLAQAAGLNTVAAITGGMKTMFLINLAATHALNGGVVHFLSLQMPKEEIQQRYLCIATDFPINDTYEGGEQRARYLRTCNDIT